MSLPLVSDANHPAFPTRSRVDDWETKRSSMPRTWRGSGRGDWDAKLPKEHSRHTRIGADLGDAEQRRETKRGATRSGRAPQDHQHGILAMLNTTARAPKGKRELREAERKIEKIKARAWRNKCQRMEKYKQEMEKRQRPNP